MFQLPIAGSLEKSLGVLLIDFFRLFGRTLYTDEVGISCRDGGAFYNKVDAGLDQPGRPFMMSVEDPADPTNDLCRGSWNILKVGPSCSFASGGLHVKQEEERKHQAI